MDKSEPEYRGVLHGWADVVGDDSHDNGSHLDGVQAFSMEAPSSFPVAMLFVSDSLETVMTDEAQDTQAYNALVENGFVPLLWVCDLIRKEFKDGHFSFERISTDDASRNSS
jgi:hypothetical protein